MRPCTSVSSAAPGSSGARWRRGWRPREGWAAREITELTLFDIVAPTAPAASFPVHCVDGDIAALPDAAIPDGTDVVFHLAAVVSAAARSKDPN